MENEQRKGYHQITQPRQTHSKKACLQRTTYTHHPSALRPLLIDLSQEIVNRHPQPPL